MATRVPLADRFLTWHFRKQLRGFRVVRRILSGRRTIYVRTPSGAVFECDPHEYIGGNVLLHGFYESEVLEALKPFFSEEATFWDIGANFGLHAVTAASLFPKMRVYAFEPIKRLRSQLKRHATMNDVDVRCPELALSNTSGIFDIYFPPSGLGGRATLRQDYASADWQKTAVKTTRADELIRGGKLEMPTVIKLDVEGLELQVFEGFGDLLNDERLRAIVFEGPVGLADQNDGDPLGVILRDAGFRITQLIRREPTQHDLENYLANR